MDNNQTAAAGFMATFFMVYLIVIVAILAFTIWVYWRIFAKAGYNGAMSLLNLVPGVGPLICMIVLAFGRWPIEDELAAARGGAPILPPMPPAPPGTAVIPS
ncbi:MAG TPA: hypothetical protein VGX91_14010 [Candidatus Cybelea sp.]|jgi:uncharacterized membrane protein YhaH (DUF805 family)|nr:hypothetical protein [Candidatus Cybelea sp.]